MKSPPTHIPVHILLADDDPDDRYFFDKALKTLPFDTQLSIVDDGEKLMTYLHENSERLPDVLFLDNNMPRKNGAECLSEIKLDSKLKALPVVMYSTYVHEDVADMFYKYGAHFYIRKTDLAELDKALRRVLALIAENSFFRPAREKFIV